MSERLTRQLWRGIDGPAASLQQLDLTGPRTVLPSAFDVTGLAVASVAVASLGLAEMVGRTGAHPRVRVDSRDAASAFLAERRLAPIGWELPTPWDAVAGDYRTADGWIRLHTNYGYHRRAALDALALPRDAGRETVAAAVRERRREELEQAVVGAGGCAAILRTQAEWLQHPAGQVAAGLPAIAIRTAGPPTRFTPRGGGALEGLRVLDITRVIAGPTCTRFLAGYGADVLRIDPPGFAEVGALLPLTTEGKRCATVDLSTEAGREQLLALLADADVLVHGLRPGALERLGLGDDRLVEQFPSLVIGQISAYGTEGPWGRRRGFDSLVQMSAGIVATETERAGTDVLTPLPAQALDHATGYLLAAGICRLLASGQAGTVSTALAATARLLSEHRGPHSDVAGEPALPDLPPLTARATAWGQVMATSIPGEVAGIQTDLRVAAGPLGRDVPRWR